MWKIGVSREYQVYKFTDKFVKDLLLWAIRNRGISTHDEILKSQMSDKLRALASYKKYKNKFKDCMLALSRCKRIGSVLSSFHVYSKKYHLILQGKVRPPKLLSETTIDEIEGAFEYLYKSILNSKFFWKVYNPNQLYKSRQEVREEQGRNKVCPYCDQQYISADIKSNMDHFLPISNFPFLSIHWANLIVSCSICNGILVKNKNWYIPILHPYYDHIENLLYFSFDRSKQLIQVNTRTNLPGVRKGKIRGENMISLLKYNKAYQGVWEEVEDERKSLEDEVGRSYQDFKDDSLNEKNSYKILETAIGRREIYLKGKKRKKTFIKLKCDYGKEYLHEYGREYIEWLRREQKEMLSQRE
ncbi:hypothetical protein ACFVRR_17755 [Gottfriedia sp. NPDC057948]|uniref:hypothetical protein n=1 Tax=Gottfriedia sp. NPDC057948 TaxID=3346287 RepID=UPI0036DC1981